MKGQVLHFVQLHLVHVGGLIFACVCVFDLCLDEEVEEVTWASVCNKRFLQKILVCID